jgi:hypothetical protein
MCVTMVVAVMIVLAVAMITGAALRPGHACQHARADPLQHIDNDQPAAPA